MYHVLHITVSVYYFKECLIFFLDETVSYIDVDEDTELPTNNFVRMYLNYISHLI